MNMAMTTYENMVGDYVKETKNHVAYQVTPLFDGDDLLANGVLMEAESVEDKGADILYCVFLYNVQPGGELPAVKTAGFGGFSTSFELPSTVSYTQMAVMRRKSGA